MPSLLSYDENVCTIVCPSGTKLVDLAFGMEFMSNNFCGRGVYRWSVVRMRGDNGDLLVTGQAMSKTGPLLISQVSTLYSAVEQKVIPLDISEKESFRFDQEKRLAYDGQNLHRGLYTFKRAGMTESVIESLDMNPNVLLATFSYGFADLATGLFALGVNELKYQISRRKSQLYIRHNLSDERVIRFFHSEGNDYDIESTVEKLS